MNMHRHCPWAEIEFACITHVMFASGCGSDSAEDGSVSESLGASALGVSRFHPRYQCGAQERAPPFHAAINPLQITFMAGAITRFRNSVKRI